MDNIFCPYCAEPVELLVDGIVKMHSISHNESKVFTCPMSCEHLSATAMKKTCEDCGQEIQMFINSHNDFVLEGHKFTWAIWGREHIKVPPRGKFFSRVWCNRSSGVSLGSKEDRQVNYTFVPDSFGSSFRGVRR